MALIFSSFGLKLFFSYVSNSMSRNERLVGRISYVAANLLSLSSRTFPQATLPALQ